MYVKAEDMERRCLPTAELRLGSTDAAPKITGYAAVFNTWTDIGGWFKESIRTGAFAKTIKENDIRALLNHDENYVLGRNKSGTLRLHEDARGLAVEIDPVPATWANDLLASMKRGDVNQMSFGFQVNKEEVDQAEDKRTLVDVTLFDVSVVTFPAYPTTSAQVRSRFTRETRAMDISDLEAVLAKMKKEEPMTADDLKVMEKYMAKMKAMMDGGMNAATPDKIMAKLKAGESLTADEVRVLSAYIPALSEPPAKVIKPEERPRDSVAELIIKAARATALSTS